MYCRQVYFPTPAFSLNRNTFVVDLGANAGLFSILAALAGCKVIAVEAQAGFVRELESLSALYGVSDKIWIENVLVGSKTGVLSDVNNLKAASHFDGIVPRQIAMEELLSKYRVDYLDFLKVDIEGSEFDLFRWCTPWINKVKRLAMEVHPSYGDVQDLVGIIRSHGLSIEMRDNDLRLVDSLDQAGGYIFARRMEAQAQTER